MTLRGVMGTLVTLLCACTHAVPARSGDEVPASPGHAPGPATPARVLALARLPAATFADGPPSGSHLVPAQHGSPWPSQPVQGFSALVAQPDGGFLTIEDNGYGVAENSSDFLLRGFALQVDFDAGTLTPTLALRLRDPDRLIPWPIAGAFTAERLLTGADLDPESLAPGPDGTWWVGDEFGPFLLHVDATGRLLEPPVALTDGEAVLRSPDNPFLRENLLLRSMEALRADARAHGAKDPWCSPDQALLRDKEQVKQLRAAGFRVVPWTVNDPGRQRELLGWQVDGLITDRPDLVPPDAGVDLEGHRGARGLRPESTLPAFEAALDLGVTTLELDLTATKDGAIVWHDATMGGDKCRATSPRAPASVLDATSAALASQWICDGVLSTQPEQRLAPSPVAEAFAADRGLNSPYSPVTPGQLLDFIRAYEAFYASGPGAKAAAAKARALTARRVRLNVETKIHPSEREQVAFLTDRIGQLFGAPAWRDRVSLQSFDWRSLVLAHQKYPWLQTVALVEEKTGTAPDQQRAGLPWPEQPRDGLRVQRSGGFENLAPRRDGTLVAMLEKPLDGGAHELRAYDFDPKARRFTGLAFRLPLAARALGMADLALDATGGYALERDNTDGEPDGYKHLVRFSFPARRGELAARTDAADLVRLRWPDGRPFSFNFVTIEGVAILPDGTLAIVNDNNFPFGHARGGPGPDGTELILVAPSLAGH